MTDNKIVEEFKDFVDWRIDLLGNKKYVEIYLENEDVKLLQNVLRLLETHF